MFAQANGLIKQLIKFLMFRNRHLVLHQARNIIAVMAFNMSNAAAPIQILPVLPILLLVSVFASIFQLLINAISSKFHDTLRRVDCVHCQPVYLPTTDYNI